MQPTVKQRNLGLDLLRAIAMLFVICQHMIGQGGLLENTAMGSGKYFFLSFLEILVYCAVDIYGITTGYLMCRKEFRLSRVVKIWLITVFWSVAVSCCFFVVRPEFRTIKEMVSMFLPLLRGRYWFFTAYFVVMLISPALNILIHSLSKYQFHLLFASLFLIFGLLPIGSLGYDVLRISSGHHFSWMIVLYLIGGYLQVHSSPGTDIQKTKKTGKWLAGYFLFAVVHLLYKLVLEWIGLPNFGNLLLTYPSPLVLGEAVCLFQYLKETGKRIRNDGFAGKLIRFASPGIYSVYVIHVHPKVFWCSDIIALFRSWDSWGCLQVLGGMLLTALSVFAACILLDKIRQWLFHVLNLEEAAEKELDWLEQKLRSMLA